MKQARAEKARWWRRNFLRTYLVAIGLAVLPLAVFIVGGHNLLLHESTQRLIKQSSRSGNLLAGILERSVQRSASLLEAFAVRSDVRGHWQQRRYPEIAAALAEVQRLWPEFTALGLYDGAGRIQAAVPADATFLDGFGFTELEAGVRTRERFFLSPTYRLQGSSEPLVAIAVPLRDELGGVVGILVGQQTLAAVTRDAYAPLNEQSSLVVFLADQKGQVFGKGASQETPLARHKEIVDRLIKRRDTETGERFSIGGQEVIAAYSPIPSLGWGVLINVPVAMVSDALWKGERMIALFGAITLLVALVGGGLVAALVQRFRVREQGYQEQIERQNRELELRNREVERATHMKSEFLASMSHELRTPLNAILGFSELLEDGRTSGSLNEKQLRFVSHVRTASRHLLRLINDILDLSKIEAGHVDLQLESFLLKYGLAEVLSNIRPLAMEKKITVEQDVGMWVVHADRVRLKQVMYNLLSNAVKFTPAGGRVCVTAAAEGEMIRVSVSDTGMGISAEDQKIVFEEFRQAAASTKGIKEGTGLGLAITKRLIEQHGGAIRVASTPQQGSTFSFTIPRARSAPAAPLDGASPAAENQSPLVLVIDDEPSARELMISFLEPEGYRVATAASGQEGMRQAIALKPAAITLNMLSPGKSGWETLYELKENPQTSAIPVIIVSVVDRLKLGFALGASEYLVKPIAQPQLLAALARHIPREMDPVRVLVVDDEPQTLSMIEEVLAGAGYACDTAGSGSEALSRIRQHRPDAVLLDLLMPEMDGFAVIRYLREHEELHNLPLFVLTAKDLTESETSILQRDTQAFFRKDGPWKADLLAQIGHAVRGCTRSASASL